MRVGDCYHDPPRRPSIRGSRRGPRLFDQCLKLREETLEGNPRTSSQKSSSPSSTNAWATSTAHRQSRGGQEIPPECPGPLPGDSRRRSQKRRDQETSLASNLHPGNRLPEASEPGSRRPDLRQAPDAPRRRGQGSRELPNEKDYMVNLARCGESQAAAQKAEEIRKQSSKDVDTLLNLCAAMPCAPWR